MIETSAVKYNGRRPASWRAAIIIHEFRLTWRKVVKLQGHVTEKKKSRGVSWAQRTPKEFRLQPTSEELQRCGCPYIFWQAVPDGRSSSSERTITNCRTLRATANQCRGRRRADVGDAEQISRQVDWCCSMEATVHKHCQPERDPLRNTQPVKTAQERRDVDLSTDTQPWLTPKISRAAAFWTDWSLSMRPISGWPKNFPEPLSTPTATFPEVLMGFCSD